MKSKKLNIISVILFIGFMAAMFVLYLTMPKTDFSEREKRYLAEFPAVTWENIASGNFSADLETYLADAIPGRDFFVGVSSYYNLFTGRQVTKDIYVAENNRLVEAPPAYSDAAIKKNTSYISAFTEKVDIPVDLMVVPSAGFIYEDNIKGIKNDYTDDKAINSIYASSKGIANYIDICSAFAKSRNKEALYYLTDHHWTSFGAYTAYTGYMDVLKKDYPAQTDFNIEKHGGFYGSNHSRAGLWLHPSEDVELWKNDTEFTVVSDSDNKPHNGLFYEERLTELDKYTVYLNGNHAKVSIDNPDAKAQGKLLVIRDSYANCLGTFLANSFENVTLVDLRYYHDSVSDLAKEGGFTNILICYSLSNFMSDANFPWLK